MSAAGDSIWEQCLQVSGERLSADSFTLEREGGRCETAALKQKLQGEVIFVGS